MGFNDLIVKLRACLYEEKYEKALSIIVNNECEEIENYVGTQLPESIIPVASWAGDKSPWPNKGTAWQQKLADDNYESEFVIIPSGTLSKNNNDIEIDAFVASRTLTTQEQYQEVMGSNPSYFSGEANLPVESVTLFDAMVYCNKRSISEGYTPCYYYRNTSNVGCEECSQCDEGEFCSEHKPKVLMDPSDLILEVLWDEKNGTGYRLPSSDEWEYMTRAGTTTDTYNGDISSDDETVIDEIAWYAGNSDSRTHPVGQKKPNQFHIYDMIGLLWKWTQTKYEE